MMRRCLFTILLLIFVSGILQAQTPLSKAAADAYIITRMINKFHVQPRALNDTLSNDLFYSILHKLDEDKIFFTTTDINQFQPYSLQLDDEIKQRKTAFMLHAANLYQQRLQQADSFIQQVSAIPFNFSADEKLAIAEDTATPANEAMLKQKLYKSMKLYALEYIMDQADDPASLLQPANKKILDSIEMVARKKAAATYRRYVSRVLQSPGGVMQYVCDAYCESLALCYDPHTEYFPPTEKENFESQLGQKHFVLVFLLMKMMMVALP